MNEREFERLLLSVQKPGRYSGGEINSVIKDKEKVDVRFAFCFPDTYEIGMSHLGMKILYSQFNARSDIWCERVFAPWTDFEEKMRQHNIPLFALESRDAIKDFDKVIVSRPEFDIETIDENGVVLTAKFFVKPDVEINDYKGILHQYLSFVNGFWDYCGLTHVC